jgi:hypothetical protein
MRGFVLPESIENDTLGESRLAELEARYGSDEALGVEWNEEIQRSLLPDGEPAVICSFCAAYIVRLEGAGKVIGFHDGENPTAHAAGYPGGAHDFALIDDRYIVDPWVKETGLTSKRAVFDLQDPRDREEIRFLYGDPRVWEEAGS